MSLPKKCSQHNSDKQQSLLRSQVDKLARVSFPFLQRGIPRWGLNGFLGKKWVIQPREPGEGAVTGGCHGNNGWINHTMKSRIAGRACFFLWFAQKGRKVAKHTVQKHKEQVSKLTQSWTKVTPFCDQILYSHFFLVTSQTFDSSSSLTKMRFYWDLRSMSLTVLILYFI